MQFKSEIKLKVCGMRDPENILEVASLKPDYLGFIFFSKSPRYVQHNFTLPEGLSSQVKKVGVFVNESNDIMVTQMHRMKLDYLQLHGNESVKQCEELKEEGAKIIKVFSIDDDFDFALTKPYQDVADFFLFDTKGKYYGGNAKTFDWSILNRYHQQVPFFISGGINAENVKQVANFKNMNIHAIDVNSGAETAPGIKNSDELKKIIDILTTNPS